MWFVKILDTFESFEISDLEKLPNSAKDGVTILQAPGTLTDAILADHNVERFYAMNRAIRNTKGDSAGPGKATKNPAISESCNSPMSFLRTTSDGTLHIERNHQGLGNRLIAPEVCPFMTDAPVQRQKRLAGLLNDYHRATGLRFTAPQTDIRVFGTLRAADCRRSLADLCRSFSGHYEEMIKSVFPDAEAKTLNSSLFDELDAFTPHRQTAGHRNGAKFVRTVQQVSPPLGY